MRQTVIERPDTTSCSPTRLWVHLSW